MTPTIDCGSFRLRPWRASDKTSLLRYANNRNISRNLNDIFPFPYTEADADDWLRRVTPDNTDNWAFVIEIDGEAAGAVGVDKRTDVFRYSAAIGYWLAEPFWGHGIMSKAIGKVTTRALARDDVYRLRAHVFAWNIPSMRVLQKCGYAREGVLVRSGVKDGVLFDQALYAITRDPGLPYVPLR